MTKHGIIQWQIATARGAPVRDTTPLRYLAALSLCWRRVDPGT